LSLHVAKLLLPDKTYAGRLGRKLQCDAQKEAGGAKWIGLTIAVTMETRLHRATGH